MVLWLLRLLLSDFRHPVRHGIPPPKIVLHNQACSLDTWPIEQRINEPALSNARQYDDNRTQLPLMVHIRHPNHLCWGTKLYWIWDWARLGKRRSLLPAYLLVVVLYVDHDIFPEVRRAGRRVDRTPKAQIVHEEASAGTIDHSREVGLINNKCHLAQFLAKIRWLRGYQDC